jgi:hypothetical protein
VRASVLVDTQQNETETKRRLIRLSGAIERRFFYFLPVKAVKAGKAGKRRACTFEALPQC